MGSQLSLTQCNINKYYLKKEKLKAKKITQKTSPSLYAIIYDKCDIN